MLSNQVNLGYFALVARTIQECFKPVYGTSKTRIKHIKKQRRQFASSTMVKLWCDCSENFEYNKLNKLIIDRNNDR